MIVYINYEYRFKLFGREIYKNLNDGQYYYRISNGDMKLIPLRLF